MTRLEERYDDFARTAEDDHTDPLHCQGCVLLADYLIKQSDRKDQKIRRLKSDINKLHFKSTSGEDKENNDSQQLKTEID